jgi:pyrroloquinoline quinone biosynthesis protein B
LLKSNFFLLLFLLVIQSCVIQKNDKQYITVLGTVQDAGYPQIGCLKDCCNKLYNKNNNNYVTSIGLSDIESNQRFLFEATPDMPAQMKIINENFSKDNIIDGIFLTHAHIGHYSGLMYLGREAYGGSKVPVFGMPRMLNFLSTNGPWSQLVSLNNIELRTLNNNQPIKVTDNLTIIPLLVPHRDEFSETVGFKIIGPEKSALFIPDINKWELWDKDIVKEVKSVDYAFLDATFFQDGEIERPMSEIPHPFVKETMDLFNNESKAVKNKIYFIHFNHTNIALENNNSVIDSIKKLGYNFSKFGDKLSL